MSDRRRAAAGLLVTCLVVLAVGPWTGVGHATEPTPEPGASQPAPTITLQIDSMSPRVVTTGGSATLAIAGRLINTGKRAIDALEVRVQRSAALRGEGEVRAALAGDLPADAVITDFVGLPGALAPGATREVRLMLALRGQPPTGLALAEPGSYELLINVNGTPAGDVRARLAAARTLLPVLGLPPEPRAPGDVDAPQPATPPEVSAANPLPVGLLYPIADQPRWLPTGPGEPVLLADDELATSLEPTGRLGGLVAALRQAPAGSDVRAATCLAVDPALLQTVASMAAGYRFRNADGTVVEGRGAAAAGRWIEDLRAAARGGCVLALPYADADLVALSRGGLADLGGYAVQRGAQVATTVLDIPVVAASTWPAEGVLDELSLTDYVAAGGRSVVLSAEAVSLGRTDRAVGPAEVVRLPAASGRQAHALLTDPLLTLAADPAARPAGAQQETVAGPGGQDVVGALAFRATNPEGAADRSEPLLLAPPHLWQNTAEGATGLLTTMRELLGERRVTTRNIADLLTNPAPGNAPAGRLLYSARAGAAEVPSSVIRELYPVRDDVADLRAAAENTPGVGRSPAEVFDPATDAMLVAASSAWRNWPERAAAAQEAISGWVEALRNSVRVVEPPAPYTLAGEQAPLLLTVANGLPVAMNVRVELTATSGLRMDPVPVQRIPPQGRIQLRVNAEVSRSGQFPVYARVLTPNGVELGPPSRLLVSSSAYGTIAVWLTVVAGVLLVVLAGRRILRRIRGERAPGRTPSGPTPAKPDPADSTAPTDPAPTDPVPPAHPPPPVSPTDRPSETAQTRP